MSIADFYASRTRSLEAFFGGKDYSHLTAKNCECQCKYCGKKFMHGTRFKKVCVDCDVKVSKVAAKRCREREASNKQGIDHGINR